MLGVLACSNSPYSCDPAVDRKLRETLELQTRKPQAANEAWARLERELIDQAIVVPVISPKKTDFVSKRVGNGRYRSPKPRESARGGTPVAARNRVRVPLFGSGYLKTVAKKHKEG